MAWMVMGMLTPAAPALASGPGPQGRERGTRRRVRAERMLGGVDTGASDRRSAGETCIGAALPGLGVPGSIPAMPSVTTTIPQVANGRPPVVLVHGAANTKGVWRLWQERLASAGWASHALDLRGHGDTPGDIATATMQDYEADLSDVARQLGAPPVLMGWSMGGLVALMTAAEGSAAACVCLAPSTPALEVDPAVPVKQGEFGPEAYRVLGDDPADQPMMQDLTLSERRIAVTSLAKESQYARDQRRAGVVVRSISCPLLIVTGTNDGQWPATAYDGLWLNADYVSAPGASHWGLVLSGKALDVLVPQVTSWLDSVLPPG